MTEYTKEEMDKIIHGWDLIEKAKHAGDDEPMYDGKLGDWESVFSIDELVSLGMAEFNEGGYRVLPANEWPKIEWIKKQRANMAKIKKETIKQKGYLPTNEEAVWRLIRKSESEGYSA